MTTKARKHSAKTTVTQRDPFTRYATSWHIECGRHATFDGATYEEAEDAWREHVHAETGVAPKPYGDNSVPRWEPAA